MMPAGAHVLVTGASRGIGAELALRFAEAGARVTGVARSGHALAHVVDSLPGGSRIDHGHVTADLLERSEREGLLGRVERARGDVDVLVNNAGIGGYGDFAQMTADKLEAVAILNLLTPMELTRQVVPGMIQRGRGHIVNVSSIAGAAALPGAVPYCATKGGLTHFTATLRTELKGTPIRTTVVEVGFVETDMRDSALGYGPARRAYDRIQRLRVMPDTPVDLLARATVDAVAGDRRHVRYPGRMRPMLQLPEAARRIVEWVYAGVRTRP